MKLKTFKAEFYCCLSSFLFDSCQIWVCEIKGWLWNLAIVSNGNLGETVKCRVSSGSEIRTWDLWFQGEDNTTTQKGLTQKYRRITSVTTFLPLLKRGDLYGVIPSITVLWPVQSPVPLKKTCIYTTENIIVCDEICIHILSQHPHHYLKHQVSSGSDIRTWDLWFQGKEDSTTWKGLIRKCGRITSVTTTVPRWWMSQKVTDSKLNFMYLIVRILACKIKCSLWISAIVFDWMAEGRCTDFTAAVEKTCYTIL